MDLIMTIIIVALILFTLAGFVAVVLDQRAEARHYEEMYQEERRDNKYLHDRVTELNHENRELKKNQHLV